MPIFIKFKLPKGKEALILLDEVSAIVDSDEDGKMFVYMKSGDVHFVLGTT